MSYRPAAVLAALLASAAAAPAFAQDTGTDPALQTIPQDVQDTGVEDPANRNTIVVTARRREEALQDVPISVSVLDAQLIADTGNFNIQRVQQLVPTLQFYTSNPRNSAINIRGLGAPFGLTNDGIEQGVGIYIDGVYYNRVAAATLDFVDIAQIEVLRGPQGTLYGKNTTAGAINITTRPPSFDFEGQAEISAGNYNFRQAKASVSGPLTDNLAARIGVAFTDRRGTIYNVATEQHVMSQNNLGLRGVLLWQPADTLSVTLTGDYNVQDPDCCVQIYARYGATQRAANRQYPALTAALGYEVPSTDAFDRLTDHDAPLNARNEHGGLALKVDWELGGGELTSITAYRYWDWLPSNDRDFTGLAITDRSQNPTMQKQWTQELRYSYTGDTIDFVVGGFGFYQEIRTGGLQVQGADASRWLLAPPAGGVCLPGSTALACDPSVLDGLRSNNDIRLDNLSVAAFGQLTWHVTDSLSIQPGIRVNYDKKEGLYDSVVTNGAGQLVTFASTDPRIVAQRGVLAPQSFEADFSDWNLSYDLTAAYKPNDDILLYATYARSFKSGGLNLNGAPLDAAGVPIASAFVVEPEKVNHFEIGAKTTLFGGAGTLNLTGFWTEVNDYQASVNSNVPGTTLLRGYLANADKVRVRGFEFDFQAQVSDQFRVYVNGAFTDHEYVSFVDAPCPPELSGGTVAGAGQTPGAPGVPGSLSPANCDISGQWLPGISKWAGAFGGEYNIPGNLFGLDGEFYLGYDGSYRSKFSSNASRSIYTDIDGYSLHNFRLGFRADDSINVYAWLRNAFDENYFEQLAVTSGNTGLIAGQPGDPQTFGATLNVRF